MSDAFSEPESLLTESDLGDYRSQITQSEVNEAYSLANFTNRQDYKIDNEAEKEIRLLKDAHLHLSKTNADQEKQITELEKNAEKERNYREILQREVEDLKLSLATAREIIETQPARLPRVDSGICVGRTPRRMTLHTGVGNTGPEESTNHDGLPASLAESESFCTATTSKSMSGEIRMKFETQELKIKTLEKQLQEIENCFNELSGKFTRKKMTIKSIETHVDILQTNESETKDTLETVLRNQREIYEDIQMNIDRVNSLALFEPRMGRFIEDRPLEAANTDK